jgi:dTDP-4-dehydrorhamnose 3,5-epimerase
VRLTVESRHLGDVVVIVPEVHSDARGFFSETWRADQAGELGLPTSFAQDNHSGSGRNVLRGLHFQWDPPMGKLMRVTRGAAWLVAVDVRKGSPTLGQWVGIEASAANRRQVWAPAGFARGFCVLSDFAEVQYKCTALYNPQGESSVRWNDPAIGVNWPVTAPLLSERDAAAPTLAEWLAKPESDHLAWTLDSGLRTQD